MLAGGAFGDARVAEPKLEDWGATVTYVWDPCGVLLHFTEFPPPRLSCPIPKPSLRQEIGDPVLPFLVANVG